MSVILLTNDDGIHAPGLRALEGPLAELGELWVVAPHMERSACGRSVTLDRPLRVEERGPRRLAVDGTPADCVLLAFRTLLDKPPDVVVSGINRGLNVGEDVDYSGTVGAATEGTLQGSRRSVAISMQSDASLEDVSGATKFAQQIVRHLRDNPLPAGSFLNVNLPTRPTERFRFTRQGNPLGPGRVLVDKDPRGKKYFWIAERPEENQPPANTDRGAVVAGIISVSLLTLDRNFLGAWPTFGLDGFQEVPP